MFNKSKIGLILLSCYNNNNNNNNNKLTYNQNVSSKYCEI